VYKFSYDIHRLTIHIGLKLLIAIVGIELVITVLLGMSGLETGSLWIGIANALTLGLCSSVLIYLWVARPLKQAAKECETLLQTNRRLTRRLIRAREEERTMLARALHDDIGQKLTAIQMYAAAATSQCSGKNCPAAKHDMRTIQDIATGLIETVRGQLKQLRPPQLDQLGMKAALASLCLDWENSSGVPCRLNVDDTVDTLDDAEQLNLYRIVQEGLTNVARHAGASRVYVNLKLKEDGIHLTLRDDGCGFDPSAQTKGIGLTGMRERMDLLGGSMRVESAAGKGTRLDFQILCRGIIDTIIQKIIP